MVAINADPMVLQDYMELPKGSSELAPHIHLVPPLEGMEPVPESDHRTPGKFSQDVFSHLVRQCHEAIPFPQVEALSAEIGNLVVQKDKMLELLPESERQAAVFSAYEFLFEKPPIAIAI